MKTDYIESIRQFSPANEQETADQRVMLAFITQHEHNVLLRENAIAHITSSGFIMNQTRDKVLLVHHNIRGVWGWTGGHADGDGDLLAVAVREAMEETGVTAAAALSPAIASLDVLTVSSHLRRGKYVGAHLHLSAAYLLLCDEREQIRPQPGENTAVQWFDTGHFTREHFHEHDVYLYNKLISRARQL